MFEETAEIPSPESVILFRQLDRQQQRQRLREIASVFLKLGAVAFGGPAAHIAMMEDEVVKRRRWLSRETLLDLLGITNLIPGPNSTELAIHLGYERGGWRGLFIAGSCFILPAMTLVWLLASIYVRYETVPQVEGLLYGIKPVIVVIVIQALWKLGRKVIKNLPTAIAGIIVVIAFGLGVNEIILLLLAELVIMLWQNRRHLNIGGMGLWLLPLARASNRDHLAGNLGAIAATFGIFLPAFILVGVTNPWIPKLRRSSWAGGFLDGVNAASLGLMAVVSYTLPWHKLLSSTGLQYF